jgi:HSP20 family protein
MNTMLRWSPSRQFHFHQDPENMFERFLGSIANDAAQRSSWLPAAEARIEDGTYVLQLALPGVDPKEVSVSLMDNVLTIKGERKSDHDTANQDYLVREVVYGTFQRDFTLPEGVDAAQVDATYSNGVLQVRVPAPRATTPRMIEVKAA